MEQKLLYIDVGLIDPHPDNPRKELGDLTELADSIRANGVMQNLTVIKQVDDNGKWNGRYTAVIGHRRLAASKLAGVEAVPCVISDMDHKQQVSTMLLENMQRSDLTPYEEAQGFQMMLDMGETAKTCAEKTGFSESTVRRRMKLLALDQDKFKKAEKRGGTMTDYMELEKIEDPTLKNDVLDAIGTKNFQNKLQQALETERQKKWLAERLAEVEEFASQIEKADYDTMEFFNSSYSWGKKDTVKRPDDADTVKYYYVVSDDHVSLYREKQPETDEEARERERKAARDAELNRIERGLDDASERAYNCRVKFVSDFKIKKVHLPKILIFATHTILDAASCYRCLLDGELFAELLNVEIINEAYDEESLNDAVVRSPEYAMLAAAYCAREDARAGYYKKAWNGEKRSFEIFHNPNEKLTNLYNFLLSLGYEMSDEEKALEDGTHELFEQAKVLAQTSE